jgi:23S rRNA (uridine2552-2'-O)-methyltransferase
MARSKSSQRWLQEHVNDPYVKRAQVDGYRARAAYKLIELNEKDKLIQPGMLIVDLGSAPGSWSQIAGRLVGVHGRVVASDILPMDALEQVTFIQGDFTEDRVFNDIVANLNNAQADVVISDMAPNMSGIAAVDQSSAIYLVELALDMARKILKPNGHFVSKVFHGEGCDQFIKDVKTSFEKVMVRKPKASRARSREVYVVAKNFKG